MSSETGSPGEPPKPSFVYRAIEGVGGSLMRFVEQVGGLAELLFQIMKWSVRPPFRVQNLFAQLLNQ